MLIKIKEWINSHKLTSLVVFIFLAYLILRILVGISNRIRMDSISSDYLYNKGMGELEEYPTAPSDYDSDMGFEETESVSSVPTTERKVITSSSLSLVVKKVDEAVKQIQDKTLELNGFMVNTSIRREETSDSATIEVRVPSDKLSEFSEYLRLVAAKVVYENIKGRDITDQYKDYEKRIESLEYTITKLSALMERAGEADDLLRVQNRIIEIQNQIDSLKGELRYMDEASKTSKVTIYISTEELNLPYYPSDSWKPKVIFKQAVRSMFSVLQKMGTLAIWLVVFAPLIVIAVLVWRIILKKRRNKLS